MSNYQFTANCVSANGDDITAMVDQAQPVTYQTFCRHVGAGQLKGLFPFYSWHGRGLTLKKDYCVSYYRSKYRGVKCYYVDHSAIEYVFCAEETL